MSSVTYSCFSPSAWDDSATEGVELIPLDIGGSDTSSPPPPRNPSKEGANVEKEPALLALTIDIAAREEAPAKRREANSIVVIFIIY